MRGGWLRPRVNWLRRTPSPTIEDTWGKTHVVNPRF